MRTNFRAFIAAMALMMSDQKFTAEDTRKNMAKVDGYYSRGKGGRKSPRTASGVARAKRDAKKAHNVRIRSSH